MHGSAMFDGLVVLRLKAPVTYPKTVSLYLIAVIMGVNHLDIYTSVMTVLPSSTHHKIYNPNL